MPESEKVTAKITKVSPEDRLIGLAEFADGAVNEQFLYALEKVLENIADQNTNPCVARKIQINIVFKPNQTREIIGVKFTCKPTLAPDQSVETMVYLGKAADQHVLHEQGNLFGNREEI